MAAALSACNAGDPGEGTVDLESGDSALTCFETQSCADASPRGLCTCETELRVVTRSATNPLRCHRAMEVARERAYAAAEAACSVGICNPVERERLCEVGPDGLGHALFELTYSCWDSVTCG
ncbi:hypothetical protein A176_002902 [Myxococcus hansupus]|uniref:Lipoprotein n=1 Tax=Pseudomyxococcus hansupus TaxID=1297742 RepID=A0A0H4WXD8_9BACT|nr:hypothetical protein A176_002902 [Myxococcus hansupus]